MKYNAYICYVDGVIIEYVSYPTRCKFINRRKFKKLMKRLYGAPTFQFFSEWVEWDKDNKPIVTRL